MTTLFQATRSHSMRHLVAALALCWLCISVSAAAQTTPRYAAEPATTDNMFYVSVNGNDANNCRSWGRACKTISQAYTNCVNQGASANTCVIHIGRGAACTPTAGQGLWLMGALDPNFASPPAGWLKVANSPTPRAVTFIGDAPGAFAANAAMFATPVSCGSATDPTKPAVWLSDVPGISLINLNLGTVCIGINLGIDSNGARTNVTANNDFFYNVQGASNSTGSCGPFVNGGQNLLWDRFEKVDFQGDVTQANGTDGRQAFVFNPGATGQNNGLIYITDAIFNGGSGIKEYIALNQNSGSLIINGPITQEAGGGSQNCDPILHVLPVGSGAISSTVITVTGDLVASDCAAGTTAPVIQNDLNGMNANNLVVYGQLNTGASALATQLTKGPMTLMKPVVFISPLPITSMQAQGEWGVAATVPVHNPPRIEMGQDSARRGFAPTAVRFTNLASQLSSTWGSSGSPTVTTGIIAPDGTANAVQIGSRSGNSCKLVDTGTQTWAAGDGIIVGVWVQAGTPANGFPTANGIGGVVSTQGTGTYTLDITSTAGTALTLQPPYKGDGEWEWISVGDLFTSGSSTGFWRMNLCASTTQPLNVYGPIILHLTSSQVSASEFYYILEHLQTYAETASAGDVMLMRGQRFSFGVPGSNFFGKFTGSFSADRQFGWPDAAGTVSLSTAQSCGTTSTCSATNILGLKVVYGSVPLVSGTPSTVTITGISPAFTSSSSYVCTPSEATNAANNLLKVAKVSGSSFTITGPNAVTDTINYICVGN